MPRIILKRSNTGGESPRLDEIEFGELAINTSDGKLFTKIFETGVERIVEIGAGTSSELEKITENGNTGWRLLGWDPDRYGNIGNKAVDLSIQTSTTGSAGATGYASFACNANTKAGGDFSVAFGSHSEALGHGSQAMGAYSIARANYAFVCGYQGNASASASYSFAGGYRNSANSMASFSFGRECTSAGDSSTTIGNGLVTTHDNTFVVGTYNYDNKDTNFIVGMGTSDNNRLNAFEVDETGAVYAPSLNDAKIYGTSDSILVTKSYVVGSFPEVFPSAGKIRQIVAMTQADYDGLPTPRDPETLFIITS